MKYFGTALSAVWSIIREPLMLFLSFIAGKKYGQANLEAKMQDKAIKNVAKAKRLRESVISDNDSKRLCDKYSRK